MAVVLGLAWYWISITTMTQYGYLALFFGLAVGLVVSYFAGGYPHPAYSLVSVGATLAGLLLGDGLLLILPNNVYHFEFTFYESEKA